VLKLLARGEDIERICYCQKVQCPSSVSALIPVRFINVYLFLRAILCFNFLSFRHSSDFLITILGVSSFSQSHLSILSHFTLCISESASPFHRTYTSAESPSASRETIYVLRPFTKQADHKAPSRLIRSRVQSLILFSLYHAPLPLRYHTLGAVSFSSLPLFNPSTMSLVALPSPTHR